ncbi:hypothetical protein [Salipiger sp. PrR003]|uniref:hypothetical protein n=1 Tax=Salipiger sp. PrR003 TaxID=2706776 RepID=UPI0013DCCFA6|nr:hypothetical protein [Salipiger sp. PrR003]NDV52852.1 hypothetical protein [Salipiger sp. PrR003]
MSKIICIYHGGCPDGFTAAWVVNTWIKKQQALGALNAEQEVEFYGDSYVRPNPPDVTDAHVIMVDFSYKSDTLLKLNDSCRTMLVLDHHKSAEAELEGTITMQSDRSALESWSEGVRDNHVYVNPIGIFDMERSGARLAWDVLFPDDRTPLLVQYVEDRDLWRNKMPNTKAINKYIMSQPMTLESYSEVMLTLEADTARAISEGEAILRQFEIEMDATVEEAARRMTLFGYEVPVVNAPHFMASDIARKLFDGKAPFVAIYYDLEGGRKFSLRAPKDSDVDVSKLACTFETGGGHAQAAGFTAPAGWEGDAYDGENDEKSLAIMEDALAAVIGEDAYDCTREWSAWRVGTMGESDFEPVVHDQERMQEIAETALGVSKAMIAASYEAAAVAMNPMLRSMISRGEAAKVIRSLTPADASAALAAKVEPLETALRDAGDILKSLPDGAVTEKMASKMAARIDKLLAAR